jgi:hypothetical protein
MIHALCDCGKMVAVDRTNFGRRTFSCGCLMVERVRETATRHGLTGTAEHEAWMAAKGRCFNDSNPAFANYGGRGITMSAEWRDSFEAFLADMGARPSGLTLDRINNEGNYEAGNCRWATRKQQANNRRPARRGGLYTPDELSELKVA